MFTIILMHRAVYSVAAKVLGGGLDCVRFGSVAKPPSSSECCSPIAIKIVMYVTSE